MSAVAGRVPNDPGRLNLNELLSQADPSENEVFSESFPVRGEIRNTAINPAFHILETFSRPKYVEASEFRKSETPQPEDFLPPSLDINRQLTLISASKSYRAPETVLTPADEPIEVDEGLPSPAALFRDDVSRTFNDPNPDQSPIDVEEDGEEPFAPLPLAAAGLSEPFEVREDAKEQAVPFEESLPTLSFQRRKPLSHSLSPLGHILAGFHGEIGPFGGDHLRDSFISGFRPDDY